MNRRSMLLGMLGIGAAATGATLIAPAEALAAMPIAPMPDAEPVVSTAEVDPGRDSIPTAQNAQVVIRRRVIRRRPRRAFVPRRRIVVRPRRRRVIIRRPRIIIR